MDCNCVDPTKKHCKCNCGYTCGGPGVCDLFAKDASACINTHYKKDCDHDWSGPNVELKFEDGGSGGSSTCAKCGMLYMSHSMMCGI